VETLKSHIVFKISLLLLVVALLTPSAVKFSHIFEEHLHEVCEYPQTLHYHEFDLDCEFYKFKLSTTYTIITPDYEITSLEYIKDTIASQYHSINDFQKLQTSLRGPPSII
jgi:hypothetical protein